MATIPKLLGRHPGRPTRLESVANAARQRASRRRPNCSRGCPPAAHEPHHHSASHGADMNPARLRAVLQSIRWAPETLAAALAIKPEEVEAWLDGSKRIPASVAEWLEGLFAAHEQRPHPEGWFRTAEGRGSRSHRLCS
jgi:hypothetical protein